MSEPMVSLDERTAHAGPLRVPCPDCGVGVGSSCVVEVQALPGDARPGTARYRQVLELHGARVAASSPGKRLNGHGVDHYVEGVLGVLDEFPDGPTRCYGVEGPEAVAAAARHDFERAQSAYELAYPHVVLPS